MGILNKHSTRNTHVDGNFQQYVLFSGNLLGIEEHSVYYPGQALAILTDPDGNTIQTVNLDGYGHFDVAYTPEIISIYAATSGTLSVYDNRLNSLWHFNLGSGGSLIGINDIDGDKKDEIVVCNDDTVYVFSASGDEKAKIPIKSGLKRGALGDINGDQKVDIIVAGTDGIWTIESGSSNTDTW
ncbi:MAG: VCBS repeat-containing protein [Pseudomonadota bacterium]